MEAKRRVLYISYDCITEPLSESQVLPYIKGLSQKYDIYLATFNKRKVAKETLGGIGERYGVKRIFSLSYHKWPSFPATVFDICCGVIKYYFVVRLYRISLIHARSYVACAIALGLKKITGVRYIFDVRGLLADERADSGDWKRESISYKIVKLYAKIMLKESAKIVLLSRNGVNILEDIMGGPDKKIAVIPTCVDTQLFSPKKTDRPDVETTRFVYIGSLGTWYMLPEMLDFFKVANKIFKNARLLIITWSDISAAKELIADKGIDRDLVEFRKEFHDRIPYYLNVSDASIFFIKPVFSKKVSCPTKFAESLSMGLPVITNSGVGDIDRIVKKYSVGVIVDNFRKTDYEKAANELLNMLKEPAAFSNRCRDAAIKEFSLESGIKKYDELYESIR